MSRSCGPAKENACSPNLVDSLGFTYVVSNERKPDHFVAERHVVYSCIHMATVGVRGFNLDIDDNQRTVLLTST